MVYYPYIAFVRFCSQVYIVPNVRSDWLARSTVTSARHDSWSCWPACASLLRVFSFYSIRYLIRRMK
jgi:hypothetical protein